MHIFQQKKYENLHFSKICCIFVRKLEKTACLEADTYC